MKLPQTGGCQCGKIRYEITEAPRSVYACHCRDCQRLTSSAFSMGSWYRKRHSGSVGLSRAPSSASRIAAGRAHAGSVPIAAHGFAGPARDGVIRLRAGTLDDTSWLRPTRHIWVRSKQPWVVFDAGDETFETAPPA